MNTLTQEELAVVQKDIESATVKIQEILKEYSLSIGGTIVKMEIAEGVFADTCKVGYFSSKFAKEEAPKVELKSE